jgi:hypothetical protein
MSHIFSHRRVGVLVLTGAAAGLITLAAAGSASATPDTPYVPIAPSFDLDSVALNPQPLPPGPDWSRVALNPQPLPPGPDWSWVALNPQPLPPGPPDLSLVALNPQPLPPGPADLGSLRLPRLGF